MWNLTSIIFFVILVFTLFYHLSWVRTKGQITFSFFIEIHQHIVIDDYKTFTSTRCDNLNRCSLMCARRFTCLPSFSLSFSTANVDGRITIRVPRVETKNHFLLSSQPLDNIFWWRFVSLPYHTRCFFFL